MSLSHYLVEQTVPGLYEVVSTIHVGMDTKAIGANFFKPE